MKKILNTFKEDKPNIYFLFKVFILCLPFIPLIVMFFICDPYMVLKEYKRFDHSIVSLNEGHVGWQNYMNNRDSLSYNSFIMGNSCTMAFKTDEWEKYLPEKSVAVRFFENGESMAGVLQKVEALEKVGTQLDNILVVLDAKSFEDIIPSQKTKYIFSYKVAGISRLQFTLRNLQSFLKPKIALPFLEYKLTGRISSNTRYFNFGVGPIREPYTNNFINPREKEIERDGEMYWMNHKNEFKPEYRQPGVVEDVFIHDSQVEMLSKLSEICKRNKTVIKFVISPEYHQKRINENDLLALKKIFGEYSVHDFTGVNAFTSDYHHYYESGHYRPCLGKKLLKDIYNEVNM